MANTKALVLGGLGASLLAFAFTGKRGKPMQRPDTEPPTTEPDSFRSRIVQIASSQVGEPDRIEYGADAVGLTEAQAKAGGIDKLSWCGLFATWVYQQAGAAIQWVLGKGIAYQLTPTRNPQPGDLGYIGEPFQHHAIVTSVDGNTIHTIDGNSTGGLVARNTRSKSAFDAFYSVDPIDPDRAMV